MALRRVNGIADRVCHELPLKNNRVPGGWSRRQLLGAVFPFQFPVALDQFGRVVKSESREASGYIDTLPGGIKLEMVTLPAGQVLLPNGRDTYIASFSLGRTEITVAQWNAVAKLPKKKRALPLLKTGKESVYGWEPEQAAEMVAFGDIVEFCTRLVVLTGRSYRLPTDREWEYACRGGTRTDFWWGDRFAEALVSILRDGDPPKLPGATGYANPFGLADIVGNVDEWVMDTTSKSTDFHAFRVSAVEMDWLSEKFTRTGLGFRVAAS